MHKITLIGYLIMPYLQRNTQYKDMMKNSVYVSSKEIFIPPNRFNICQLNFVPVFSNSWAT